jgi:hypothetical protein
MIKLVPKFSMADIEKLIKEKKDRLDAALLLSLRRAGEIFVKNARENGSYRDRTGNLRSSVGYIIVKNGQIIEDNFRSTGKGKNAGPIVGRRVADDIAQKYRSGYALIGVAGMDYAAAVESRGFEVITSSTIIAEGNLTDAISRIAGKLSS